MSKGNQRNNGGKSLNFPFQQALLQINGAIQAAAQGGLTEATGQLILTALQDNQDYEAKIIRDSNVPSESFLEVRIYDTENSVWLPPQYYAAGSTVPVTIGGPGGPVAPITYIDPTTLLATIASNTTGLATEATLGTRATEATLAALSAKLNSLGQKASDDSLPAVLSTEQEVILNAIKTAVESIDADLGTGGLNLEATQLLVKGVLDAIKLDTGAMAVDLAAIEVLLTTIDAVLDTIKLDTANLDVALSTRASETTLLATNALLTTMDAVLDAIKLDTANLDVALSTRATEATLLLAKGVLDTIKTDTAAMVVDLAAIETLLTTIDAVLDTIKVDTGNIDTKLTGASRTPAASVETLDGSVAAGAQSVSLWFRGAGGTLMGAAVPSGARFTFTPLKGEDTVGAIAYTVPTGGAQEIIVTKIT